MHVGARDAQYVDGLVFVGKCQLKPEPPFIPCGAAAGVGTAIGAKVIATTGSGATSAACLEEGAEHTKAG